MSRCVFCAIAKKELPASVVHEDDLAMAFLDIHPVRPGHLLVVPKLHAQYIRALPTETGHHLWEIGTHLAERLRAADLADDVHLLINDGAAAWQSVPHAHLHLVPRRAGDGVRLLGRLLWSLPKVFPAKRDALDAIAERIRSAEIPRSVAANREGR